MMPEVVAFNRLDGQVDSIYRELYEGDLPERLRTLLVSAEMNFSLADLGVESDKLPQLAEEAAKQWTAQFNPISVDAAALEGVYRAAMG
jgi:alcohol dehydrogenase